MGEGQATMIGNHIFECGIETRRVTRSRDSELMENCVVEARKGGKGVKTDGKGKGILLGKDIVEVGDLDRVGCRVNLRNKRVVDEERSENLAIYKDDGTGKRKNIDQRSEKEGGKVLKKKEVLEEERVEAGKELKRSRRIMKVAEDDEMVNESRVRSSEPNLQSKRRDQCEKPIALRNPFTRARKQDYFLKKSQNRCYEEPAAQRVVNPPVSDIKVVMDSFAESSGIPTLSKAEVVSKSDYVESETFCGNSHQDEQGGHYGTVAETTDVEEDKDVELDVQSDLIELEIPLSNSGVIEDNTNNSLEINIQKSPKNCLADELKQRGQSSSGIMDFTFNHLFKLQGVKGSNSSNGADSAEANHRMTQNSLIDQSDSMPNLKGIEAVDDPSASKVASGTFSTVNYVDEDGVSVHREPILEPETSNLPVVPDNTADLGVDYENCSQKDVEAVVKDEDGKVSSETDCDHEDVDEDGISAMKEPMLELETSERLIPPVFANNTIRYLGVDYEKKDADVGFEDEDVKLSVETDCIHEHKEISVGKKHENISEDIDRSIVPLAEDPLFSSCHYMGSGENKGEAGVADLSSRDSIASGVQGITDEVDFGNLKDAKAGQITDHENYFELPQSVELTNEEALQKFLVQQEVCRHREDVEADKIAHEDGVSENKDQILEELNGDNEAGCPNDISDQHKVPRACNPEVRTSSDMLQDMNSYGSRPYLEALDILRTSSSADEYAKFSQWNFSELGITSSSFSFTHISPQNASSVSDKGIGIGSDMEGEGQRHSDEGSLVERRLAITYNDGFEGSNLCDDKIIDDLNDNPVTVKIGLCTSAFTSEFIEENERCETCPEGGSQSFNPKDSKTDAPEIFSSITATLEDRFEVDTKKSVSDDEANHNDSGPGSDEIDEDKEHVPAAVDIESQGFNGSKLNSIPSEDKEKVMEIGTLSASSEFHYCEDGETIKDRFNHVHIREQFTFDIHLKDKDAYLDSNSFEALDCPDVESVEVLKESEVATAIKEYMDWESNVNLCICVNDSSERTHSDAFSDDAEMIGVKDGSIENHQEVDMEATNDARENTKPSEEEFEGTEGTKEEEASSRGFVDEGGLMLERFDAATEEGKILFSSRQNSAVKLQNTKTILIHGTPLKADMKENAPFSKSQKMENLTTVRPAKRQALKDLSQK